MKVILNEKTVKKDFTIVEGNIYEIVDSSDKTQFLIALQVRGEVYKLFRLKGLGNRYFDSEFKRGDTIRDIAGCKVQKQYSKDEYSLELEL